MVAYRFCRPDDIPRLVEALESCWAPSFPGAERPTVEGFRREMRELDVWPSNSMMVVERAEPLAVVVGTKRADEVLVHRLGVRAAHRRQGHARHLLTSLSQKLAVLGPPRLAAEVPVDDPGAAALFAAAGYDIEVTLTDWRGDGPGNAAPPPGHEVRATSLAELAAAGVTLPEGIAWVRRLTTLRNLGPALEGCAVVAGAEIRGHAFFRSGARGSELLALSVVPGGEAKEVLAALLAAARREPGGRLRLPRLADEEHAALGLDSELLAAAGLLPAARYHRVTAEAQPA